MTDRVLAIIVCYNPNIVALKCSLEVLIDQRCDTILVDNASANTAAVQELIGQLNGAHQSGIELLQQATNLGLGAAHNIGIEHARNNHFSHVLLLDQDSVPLDKMVVNLLDASTQKAAKEKVSAVGATYLNADNGSESFFVRFGRLKFQRNYCASRDNHGCIAADFLISSGCLISLETLAEVGLMDESLFIDHVDTEWFLRSRSKGFHAYGVCDAVMQHGLGEQTHRVFLGGRKRNVPQHKPFRYYYIFRNSVLLYKRSYANRLWIWNDAQRLGMILLMFGVLKAPRADNVRAMLKGFRDGWRGITGPVDV